MKKVIAAGLAASMLAVTAVGFAGCNNDETLRSKYEDYFPVGATMSYGNFEMYEDLAKEFSSMTCENEMKWDSLQPEEGEFDYSLADPMIEFAKEHDMGVRGHCLAWHNKDAVPSWVYAGGFDAARERLLTYARTVCAHFDSTVYAWDVWNEMLTDDQDEDDTNLFRVSYADDATNGSRWHELAGLARNQSAEDRAAANQKIEQLIVDTFAAAREAAPEGTKLYYNEYFANNTYKCRKLLVMLEHLLDMGCEIDGVGIQAHYDITSFDAEMLEQLIIDINALGLDVQITEVDFSMYDYNADTTLYYTEFTPEMEELQAHCFAKVFEIARKHKDKVSCVTQWGVADDSSYLFNMPVPNRNDWPYLFDADHQPKLAYEMVMDF